MAMEDDSAVKDTAIPNKVEGEESTINGPEHSVVELVEQRKLDQQEIHSLKERIEELQSKLWEQSEANAELKRTREALSEEIMDLTKALFEEANGMVAAEAKARAHLEIARRKLESELEATKEQLRLEKQQLRELRGRFSHDHNTAAMSSVCIGDEKQVSFDKDRLSRQLEYNYFGCLLPKHRFNSRSKFTGPAADLWDSISERIAREELPEFAKFVEKSPGLDAEGLLSCPYLKKICEYDVVPCLNFEFKPKPFVRRVAISLLRNTCYVEEYQPAGSVTEGHHRVPSHASHDSADLQMGGVLSPTPQTEAKSSTTSPTEGTPHRLRGIVNHFATSVSSLPESLLAPGNSPKDSQKFCALCGKTTYDDPFLLQYRIRLCDSEPWLHIDKSCRERLVAAGHFFAFMRHLSGGLYTNRPLIDLFFDMLHFRRYMFYVRLSNAATDFFLQSDYESYLDVISEHVRGGDSNVQDEPKVDSEHKDKSSVGKNRNKKGNKSRPKA